MVSKDGKVVGFTTATTFDCEENATYTVQAANEYGGLSLAAKAEEVATGIASIANGNTAAQAIYSLDGKRRQQMLKGLNIVKGNKVKKVLAK